MKRSWRVATACLPAALALACGLGSAAAGGKENGTSSGTFSVNHVGYEMKHVYTWPSSFDMTEADGTPVKIRFFAFSNQPIDPEGMDLLQDPTADLGLSAKLGAAVVSMGVDGQGKVHLFRYALPGAEMFTIQEAGVVASEIKGSGDKWTGEFTIQGDSKTHNFDPENVALVQGEISFEVRNTRRPFAGKALPEDGGAPGKIYLAFNDALLASDRAAILHGLRTLWTTAGPAAGEILLWKDVEMHDVALHGGKVDGRRAILFGSGNCETYGGQGDFRVFLVKEEGGWKIDSLKPGKE